MARPIPSSDLRHLHERAEKEAAPKASQTCLVDVAIESIKSDSSKNLVLGTFSGWLAGVALVRVGRVAAFGLGGGVLLLHVAAERGYILVNWDRVKAAAGGAQARLERLLRAVRDNSCFSVGFLGGFFFGVAST